MVADVLEGLSGRPSAKYVQGMIYAIFWSGEILEVKEEGDDFADSNESDEDEDRR